MRAWLFVGVLPVALAGGRADVEALVAPGKPRTALGFAATGDTAWVLVETVHTTPGPVSREGGARVWREVEERRPVTGGEARRTELELVLDRDGLAYRWQKLADGTAAAVTPPKRLLPAGVKPGTTWTATHAFGEASSERSCAVEVLAGCEGGRRVRCTSRYPLGRRVGIVDDWCPGVGRVGSGGWVESGWEPPQRLWDATVSVDGREVPQLPPPAMPWSNP